MFSSPLLSLTDTQAELLGSSFPPSPLFLQSPQPSQISSLLDQSPQVNSFWHEPSIGADNFLSESELEGVPLYFPDNGTVDHPSVSIDHHLRRIPVDSCYCQTLSTIDPFSFRYPAISEVDDGSVSTLSISPAMLTPVSTRSTWSMPV